jgi:hypothetical protein
MNLARHLLDRSAREHFPPSALLEAYQWKVRDLRREEATTRLLAAKKLEAVAIDLPIEAYRERNTILELAHRMARGPDWWREWYPGCE